MNAPSRSIPAPARSPLAELLVLALPTVAQMGGYTLVNFSDTLMLSSLGETEAAAAGNASLVGFSIVSVGFGAMWVVNTLVSQAFGRGDRQACGQFLWAGVWLGVLFGLLVAPLGLLAGPVFLALGHEEALATAEADYLGIILTFTAVRLASTAGGQFLLAIDRPNRTLVAAFVAVAVNIAGNYVLIFGHFGFPAMGVAGAAWAANVGAVAELAVIAAFCLEPAVRRAYNVLDWRPRKRRLKTLFKIGLPSGLQMAGDVTAWSAFSIWVMAAFGTGAMAANTFMMRYMTISFLPAFGIGAAVTALVGRYLGRGEPDVAAARTRLGFYVTATYMLACGVVFATLGGPMMDLFTNDPEIRRMGVILLIFAAIFQLFDALYIVHLSALRGAGDTLVPAIATAALCWSLTVGVGALVAYTMPGLGIAGPWTVATIYGIVLGLFMWLRFQRGGWRTIQIDGGDDREAPLPAAASMA